MVKEKPSLKKRTKIYTACPYNKVPIAKRGALYRWKNSQIGINRNADPHKTFLSDNSRYSDSKQNVAGRHLFIICR